MFSLFVKMFFYKNEFFSADCRSERTYVNLREASVVFLVSSWNLNLWFCNLKHVAHWIVSYAFKWRRFGNDVIRLSRKPQQHFGWTKEWSAWYCKFANNDSMINCLSLNCCFRLPIRSFKVITSAESLFEYFFFLSIVNKWKQKNKKQMKREK